MQPETRAVIFDLDDTLYPLRRFVRSGFAACASFLERSHGVDRGVALRVLISASRGPARGRELQACAAHFGLPESIVPELIELIRRHQPSLRLPPPSKRALEALGTSWRIGVVTNGLPATQARKIRALRLPCLVDVVVYANDVGDGTGKPEPEPFLEAARQLGVPASRSIFVGNDLRCDIEGAARVGMRTVHVSRQPDRCASPISSRPDATVTSLWQVPALVDRLLLSNHRSTHVA